MNYEGIICDVCKTPIENANRDQREDRVWERVVTLSHPPNDAGLHATADVCNGCVAAWFLALLRTAIDKISLPGTGK